MPPTINDYHEKVDSKLIMRQRIFIGIIAILLIICIVNLVERKITTVLGISGFLLATLIGLGLSRMFKIFWHEEKQKVISQLDTMGVVILVVYILVEVLRSWIFSYWLSGAALSAFGLILLTGLLFGRFLGTGLQIRNILLNK